MSETPNAFETAAPTAGRSLLRIAAVFYGVVVLFALAYGAFSAGIREMFGEKAPEAAGLLGGLGVGLALVLFSRKAASSWAPMKHASEALADLIGPLGWGAALLLALMSGIAEELLFRGALWPHLHLVGTTIVFAVVHVLPKRALWVYPVFALVAGLLFGLLRVGTGSVWPPVVAHVVVNGCNLIWLGGVARRRREAARTTDAAATPETPA